MVTLNRFKNTELFLAEAIGQARFAFLYTPALASVHHNVTQLDFQSTWHTNGVQGYYLFFDALTDDAHLASAVEAIQRTFEKTQHAGNEQCQLFAWIENAENWVSDPENATFITSMIVTAAGLAKVIPDFQYANLTCAYGTADVTVSIPTNPDKPFFQLAASSPYIITIDEHDIENHIAAQLSAAGCGAGGFLFDCRITQQALSALDAGFRYFSPSAQTDGREDEKPLSQSFHVFAKQRDPNSTPNLSEQPQIAVRLTLDPVDGRSGTWQHAIAHNRTIIDFLAPGNPYNQAGPVELWSSFCDHVGNGIAVEVAPGAFQLALAANPSGDDNDFYFVPQGELTLKAKPSTRREEMAASRLLLGLSGTEFLEFFDGDKLTFDNGSAMFKRPLLSPLFSNIKQQSIPPDDDPFVTDSYTTAWIAIRPGTGRQVQYASQPQEAALYFDQGGQHSPFLKPKVIHREVIAKNGISTAQPMPTAPYAGTADILNAAITNIDRFGLAPFRYYQLTSPPTSKSRTGESENCVNPQGHVLGVTGDTMGVWTIAHSLEPSDPTKPDDQGTIKPFSYPLDLNTNLRDALQQHQPFMVITRDIARFSGPLFISSWTFDWSLSSRAVDKFDAEKDPIFIIKFDKRPMRELIGNYEQWTKPAIFNDQHDLPAIAQYLQRLQQKANDAVTITGATDNSDAVIFQPLDYAFSSADWTGVLILNCPLSASALPLSLRGLAGGMKFDEFRAQFLGVTLSEVSYQGQQTIPAQLQIERSTLFAGILYPPPLLTARERTAPPVDNSIYDMEVTSLKVGFDNTTITYFSCILKLTINKLFEASVEQPQPITFVGSYEKKNNADVYSFIYDAQTPVKLQNTLIDSITFTKITFTTISQTKDIITARFALWGWLQFNRSPGDVAQPESILKIDFFSFDKLLFDGVGLALTMASDGSDPHKAFDPGAIRVYLSSDEKDIRPDSLLHHFPLTLKGFSIASGNDTLSSLGYLPVAGGGHVNFRYGLLFDVDLGTLGPLVSAQKDLHAELLLGWKDSTIATGFRFASFGTSLELGIEGVVKLYIKHLTFFQYPAVADKPQIIGLALRQVFVQVLGLRLPSDGGLAVFLFIPQGGTNSKIGWYTAYKKDENFFLGIGQRVAPAMIDALPTFNSIITELKNGPKFDAYDDDSTPYTQGDAVVGPLLNSKSIKYAPDRNWLIACDDTISSLLHLGFVFNDPALYSLYLAIYSYPVEITYCKLSDDLGVYHLNLVSPVRQFTTGEVTITIPEVGIFVYTNGGWKVDVGFPDNLNFARSFRADMIPFTGSGGFYLARVSGGVSQYISDKTLTVTQIGYAVRVGLGASYDQGVFHAGVAVTIFGTLEGEIAVPPGQSIIDISDIKQYYILGQVGIIGEVYGAVDFGFLKAMVSLTVIAWMSLRLSNAPQDAQLTVAVHARVIAVAELRISIKIFFARITIVIRFSFSTEVQLSWTLVNRSRDRLALTASRNLQPLPWDAHFCYYLWQQTPIPALNLLFTPQMTLSSPSKATRGTPQAAPALVALLALEQSTSEQPASERSATHLLSALGGWLFYTYLISGNTTNPFGTAQPDPASPGADDRNKFLDAKLTGADLANINLALHQQSRPRLDYPNTITPFLRNNFAITIQNAPEATAGTEPTALYFPCFPELSVVLGQQNSPVTHAVSLAVSSLSADQLTQFNQELQKLFITFDAGPLASARFVDRDTIPVTATLFEDYIDFLLKALIGFFMQNTGKDSAIQMPKEGLPVRTLLTMLEPAKRDTDKDSSDATPDEICNMVSRFFLHGLRVPKFQGERGSRDEPLFDASQPLYELSGQQIRLSDFPDLQPEKLTVALSSSSNWQNINIPAPLQLQPEALQWLKDQSNWPAFKPTAKEIDYLQGQAKTFVFRQYHQWSAPKDAWTIWQFPPTLSAFAGTEYAPFPVLLQKTGDFNTDQPKAQRLLLETEHTEAERLPADELPITFNWATRVELKIRRIPLDHDGQYVRDLYLFEGANEENRRLLDRVLAADDAYTLHLLYGKPVHTSGAGGGNGDEIIWCSDDIDISQVKLLRTNLSVESNPNRALRSEEFHRLAVKDVYAATMRDTGDFLRLVQRCSIVNSGGYYLYYPSPGGITKAFSDGANAEVAITLLIESTHADHQVRSHYNAIMVKQDPGNAPVPKQDMFYAEIDLKGIDPTPYLDYRPRMQAGSLGYTVTRENPDANPIPPDRSPALLKAELERVFSLLAYQVADGAPSKLDFLPVSPGKRPEDSGKTNPDWYYPVAIPLNKLLNCSNPYEAVGQPCSVRFTYRDVFGNTLPDCEMRVDASPSYSDRLLPIAEWPGMSAWYEVGVAQSRTLTVHLEFAVNNINDVDQRIRDSWRETYRQAGWQVSDKNVSINMFTSLCPNKPFTISGKDLNDFIEEIRSFINKPGQLLPSHTITITLPDDAHAGQEKDLFELTVALQLKRNQNFVNTTACKQLRDVAEVASLITPTKKPDATRADAPVEQTLLDFANKFEACFSKYKLATGFSAGKTTAEGTEAKQNAVPITQHGAHALWAIRTTLFEVKPRAPIYYAPRPILNALRSDTVTNTLVDLPTLAKGQTITATDRDLDLSMRRLLDAIEELLNPKVVSAFWGLQSATQIDLAQDFQTLMDVKGEIASQLGNAAQILPLLQQQQPGDIEPAIQLFSDRLLINLSQAYTIDTIVQFPVQATPVNGYDGMLFKLYGTITDGTSESSNARCKFTNAKVALPSAGTAQATLTTLFSVVDASQQSIYAVTPQFVITHLEVPPDVAGGLSDPAVCAPGLSKPQPPLTSWLNLVIPCRPISLGVVKIPVALRQYPKPPTALAHSAEGAPGNSPDFLANVRKWQYRYQFAVEEYADQDTIYLDIVYNTGIAALRAMADNGTLLPQYLAIFDHVYCPPPPKDAATKAGANDIDWSTGLHTQLSTWVQKAMLDLANSQTNTPAIANACSLLHYFAILVAPIAKKQIDWWGWRSSASSRSEQQYSDKFSIKEQIKDNGQEYHTHLTLSPDNVQYHHSYRVTQLDEVVDESSFPPAQSSKDYSVDITIKKKKPKWFTRTVAISGLDILTEENAWGGLYVVRNAVLAPDKKTSSEFVYQTPLVRFGKPQTPRIVDAEIHQLDQGNTTRDLAAYLTDLFQQLFNGIAPGNQRMKVECRGSYTMTGDSDGELLRVFTPCTLSIPIELTDLATDANNLAAAINTWRKTACPNANVTLVIDLTLFRHTGQDSKAAGETLLRLRNVRLRLNNVTPV